MADWQKMGDALSGMGAGFSGQGEVWRRNQMWQEEQRRAEAERQRQIQEQQEGQIALQTLYLYESGNTKAIFDLHNTAIAQKEQAGGDATGQREWLQIFAQDQDGAMAPVAAKVNTMMAMGQITPPNAMGNQYRPTVSGIQTDPVTGQQYHTVYDPNTGDSFRKDVPGAFGETPSARSEREVGQLEEEKRLTKRSERTSAIISDLSARNRESAASMVNVRRALKYAQTATQGLAGDAKLFFSRVFPGIDVTDEAVLDQATKQLALDALAQFKGPTTDFEFGVVQSMAGDIGDSRTANIARLKAIDRSKWFMQRELKQFQKWVADNKNPDYWAFDFNEKISTKKGDYSLQDLQDTAVANNLTIEEVLRRLNQ